jgi:hydrogenase maturation protease
MNRALVDPIANAVLYEGYILYPYRPSVKNRQRWTFGGLFPEAYCRARKGAEASSIQVECLVHGTAATSLEAVVRFLHLTARQVGQIDPPLAAWPDGPEPPFRPVESLRVGDSLLHTWQEAMEREVSPGAVTLGDLRAAPLVRAFQFPGARRFEPVREADGSIVGVLVRAQENVEGSIELAAVAVAEGLHRLTLRVTNRTPWSGPSNRDDALLVSLVSTHAILAVQRGEFVSLLDPPACWREEAAGCRNVGVWPVLVGEQGKADMMLASPIILYDYPLVAPESPGPFFDGTEIDEMLTLRVLTLTDDEKRAMTAVDERAGDLLARTEALAREQLLALHGTIRGLRPVPEGHIHG